MSRTGAVIAADIRQTKQYLATLADGYKILEHHDQPACMALICSEMSRQEQILNTLVTTRYVVHGDDVG